MFREILNKSLILGVVCYVVILTDREEHCHEIVEL